LGEYREIGRGTEKPCVSRDAAEYVGAFIVHFATDGISAA
jgi:hypothetical protein